MLNRIGSSFIVWAIAVLVVVGLLDTPLTRAQSTAASRPRFEVASIRRSVDCDTSASIYGVPLSPAPGRLTLSCATVSGLILGAYGRYACAGVHSSQRIWHGRRPMERAASIAASRLRFMWVQSGPWPIPTPPHTGGGIAITCAVDPTERIDCRVPPRPSRHEPSRNPLSNNCNGGSAGPQQDLWRWRAGSGGWWSE